MNLFNRTKKEPAIVTKAVNSYSGSTTSIQTVIPTATALQSDPITLMSYNRGYVSACTSKIGNVLSAMPLKLYAYQTVNGAKFINSKSVGYHTSRKLMRESKAVGNMERKELVELFDHPFIDLINAPYKNYTISQLFFIISSYLNLIGNCYIVKTIDNQNQLTGLQVLESEYISIVYDKNGDITKYIYQPQGSRVGMTFIPEQIVHIKNITAGSLIVGRGELENCLESFSVTNEAMKYTRTLLKNYCVPGSAVIIKNGEGLTTDAKNQIAADFSRGFGGDSRGRTVVTDADLEVKNLSTSLNDNLTDKFVEISKKEIAAVFGVPLDLIDSTGSNRATAQTAMESLLKFTVYPKLFNILDQINRQIVHPYYSEDLLFWVDTASALETSPNEQADLYKKYYDMGILTADEIRNTLGFGPRVQV